MVLKNGWPTYLTEQLRWRIGNGKTGGKSGVGVGVEVVVGTGVLVGSGVAVGIGVEVGRGVGVDVGRGWNRCSSWWRFGSNEWINGWRSCSEPNSTTTKIK